MKARCKWFAVTFSFQIVHRTSGSAPGSSCCFGENGWTCCGTDESCCAVAGSGSLEVPGFRPMCCHIILTSLKAQCCSATAQMAGAIPECCQSRRVKPTCCTRGNTYVCCRATIGTPSCCVNIPVFRVQTPTPAAGYSPVSSSNTGSCCQSSHPQKHSCKSLQTRALQNPRKPCCSQICCAQATEVWSCCRMVRTNCCQVRSVQLKVKCCNRPGLPPTCCSDQPRRLYNHISHSSDVNIYQPSNSYSAHSFHQTSNTDIHNDQLQSTAQSSPLSCCRAVDLESCCKSGLQRSGAFPLCCTPSDLEQKKQQNHQAQQWTPERDELQNLLRADDLQTLNSDLQPDEEEISNYRRFLGKRQAHCSGFPYDTSEFMCCSGALQVKAGTQPACCGVKSFDQSTHTCCNGQVQTVCDANSLT